MIGMRLSPKIMLKLSFEKSWGEFWRVDNQYFNAPDGLSGNEDCGQMSAWYILNSMGFYQVCPGKPVYSIGRPLFEEVTINLPDRKTFVIRTHNNSKTNKYIESVLLNGKPLDVPFFTHNDIVAPQSRHR